MKALRGGYRAPMDTGADMLEDSGTEAPTDDENILPSGTASGVFLHEVLEKLDFETLEKNSSLEGWAENDDVKKLFRVTMNRNGIANRYLDHSQKLIYTTLTTPVQLGERDIPSGFGGLAQNLREVEFLYPYPESPSPLWGEVWGERPSVLKPFKIKRGYVKGFVDFVFEHQGQTYLADWKSDTLPTWTDDAINQHVENNYRLQAQLYALALIKMLEITSPVEYESRFGGIVYCFLRGMKTDRTGANSIYFRRPSWEEIRSWELELIGKTRL
jgi:exodeoxyribonuclease V beta subunit